MVVFLFPYENKLFSRIFRSFAMPRHRSRLQQSDESNPQPSRVGFATRPFASPPKSEDEL